MIGKANLNQYFRVAMMQQNINKFIRQAALTKNELQASLSTPFIKDIGQKIDLYA